MKIPTLLLCTAPLLGGDIEWSTSLEAGRQAAEAESKVIFVAVHMPGERANERMATDVYTDKDIEELAERTVNVFSMSMGAYQEHGTRVKHGLSDDQLRRLDIDVRAEVLKPDAEGFVVAPQHVFLKPDGEVILSVPYEMTKGELEWCFVRALTAVDPENAPKASSDAKPPKRLIQSGVIEGSDEAIGATAATLEEVREIIAELQKSRRVEGRDGKIKRLLTADEDEARDYITKELRGGGRRSDNRKETMIRDIGRRSPAAWWEVVVEFTEHNEISVREEVSACLEVLASEDARKDIKKALSKEKDVRMQGMWVRALASCGPADKSTRKSVLKEAGRDKDPIRHANAVLALGYLAPDEEILEALKETLQDKDTTKSVKVAAVCALAMTREEGAKELLTPLAEAEGGDLQDVAKAAIQVLEGGDLTPLGPHVDLACGDSVRRERIFGAGSRRN